jgi:hypothetical protein
MSITLGYVQGTIGYLYVIIRLLYICYYKLFHLMLLYYILSYSILKYLKYILQSFYVISP